MIFGCFPKLIIQEEKLEHALEPFERCTLQPGEGISPQRQFGPFI
jgi:hypothetical protein